MLRKTVAALTAMRRRAVASLRTPSNPNRAISTSPIHAPRPDLSVYHRPFHRFVLLLADVSSRGYARMARRIPPVLTKPKEDDDSESEGERDLFLAEEEEEEEVEEGEESEEWEGFVLDFGSDGKDKDERKDEQDS